MQSTLPPLCKLYLLTLSLAVDDDGQADIGTLEMRRRMGVSRNTERTVRGSLTELGILTQTRRQRQTTLTKVSVEAVRQYALTAQKRAVKNDLECTKACSQESLSAQKRAVKKPPPNECDSSKKPRFSQKNNDRDFCASRVNILNQDQNSSAALRCAVNTKPHTPESSGSLLDDPNIVAERVAMVEALLREATGRSGAGVAGAVRAVADEIAACPRELDGSPIDETRLARAALGVAMSLTGSQAGRASVGRIRGAWIGQIRLARENGEYPALWSRGASPHKAPSEEDWG